MHFLDLIFVFDMFIGAFIFDICVGTFVFDICMGASAFGLFASVLISIWRIICSAITSIYRY